MRWLALCCLVLTTTRALAQPAPSPAPVPDAPPEPTPSPDPPVPPPPRPEDPAVGPPPEPAQTDPAHTPTPPPQPVAVPAPVPKTARQTATQARLAAAAKCAAHDPDCNWLATFSSLERGSILRSLAAENAEPDPAPWGKVIGKIRIRNEPVFAEKNWLRFFNLFHVTTRTANIRGELTIDEGEVWDDDRVLESQRRLKDPLYTSIVALVPVKSEEPGKVDLLVVTRDVWSLRLNTKYTIQEGSLTDLTVSLSENNFLGRRKTLAFGMTMDQGAIAVGPLYIDKNFLGEHLDFRFRIDKLLTRQSLDVVTDDPVTGDIIRTPTLDPEGIQDGGGVRSEGTAATVTLARPLWSLASKWGASSSFTYRDAVARQYFFTGLRAYDDLSTMEVETLPREYRLKSWSARASGQRQWGKEYKQQIEAGYAVSSLATELLDTRAFDPDMVDPLLLRHFQSDVFPRAEVVSGPFVEWSFFQTDYGTIRNVDTYELGEDIRFGPSGTLGLSQSFKTLGSDFRFTRPSATAGWTFPWGADGFARVSGGGQIRIQSRVHDDDNLTIDNTATAQVRAATPTLGQFRVIGQLGFETRWHDTQNQYYTLGSDSGLRAYRINQVFGDRRILGQIEARSVPYAIWVVRVGGVVFYEGGGAAASFQQMRYLHDAGFGLRMLIPQSSRELFRFDVSFPLADAFGTQAGHPRFSAGFDSYF